MPHFLEGLRAAGWVLGENLTIDYGYAREPEEIATTIPAMIEKQPEVFVAESNRHVQALRQATNSVPVVMIMSNDPVTAGLVASLSRPGGNITGMATLNAELTGKRLDLLKQALPRRSRVVCLWSPDITGGTFDQQAV